MTPRRWVAAAALSMAAVTAGCGSPNAGSAARDEFTEQVEAEHGDRVVELRLSSDNTLPFAGEAWGGVVLDDDTPPAEFAQVLDLVTTFEPSDGTFRGTGVLANGVGVCVEDPQAEGRQALRDALHAAGERLSGEWWCADGRTDESAPYAGTVADLDADARLVERVAGDTGLTFEALLTEPKGTVAGSWDDVPTTLARTLAAVAGETDVVAFELTGRRLRVAVTPTSDAAPVRAAARRATGDELEVEVLLGTLDEGAQDGYAEVAPVVDALRAVDGVTEVTAQQQAAALRVLDPRLVQDVHDAAVAVEGTDRIGLRILVGEGDFSRGASEWFRPLGGESATVDAFAGLVADGRVERVRVLEEGGGRARWIAVDLVGPLADAALLRDLLPTGVLVQLSSEAEGRLELTVADELDESDLRVRGDGVDPAAFVAAWNAAG